jgi:hypothetical protein
MVDVSSTAQHASLWSGHLSIWWLFGWNLLSVGCSYSLFPWCIRATLNIIHLEATSKISLIYNYWFSLMNINGLLLAIVCTAIVFKQNEHNWINYWITTMEIGLFSSKSSHSAVAAVSTRNKLRCKWSITHLSVVKGRAMFVKIRNIERERYTSALRWGQNSKSLQ